MISLLKMNSHEISFVKNVYEKSFPESEKKPFDMILDMFLKGLIDIYVIKEKDKRLGIAIIDIYEDVVLLDYFAIDDIYRNKGYGSLVLRLLQEKYKDVMFILEIESPDVPCHNLKERQRRKQFYLDNGMKSMGYLVSLGVPMEVFYYQKPVCFEKYKKLYWVLFHRDIGDRIMLKES